MKFSRGSIKFLLGFVAIVGVSFGAWEAYAQIQLNSFVMRELPVTRVNLIAVKPEAGYRILIANQMAQLVELNQDESGEGQGAAPANPESADEAEGERRRLPVKDMLGAMQGNVAALSRFVMILNKLDENDLPPAPVVWKSEDLETALSNPGPLRSRLEEDINLKIDGTPLDEIRPDALEVGIVIDFPVPVRVIREGAEQTLIARIKVPFLPQFSQDIMNRIKERPEITDDTIRGTYLEEARKILNGDKPKEDITKSIRGRYSVARVEALRQRPERVLRATSVVLNDEQLVGASVFIPESSDQGMINLNLKLNDEGKKRLWKYSRANRGFQVLLTVDGIPVAAPRFREELITHDVTIKQLGDQRLAEEAANVINEPKQEGNTNN